MLFTARIETKGAGLREYFYCAKPLVSLRLGSVQAIRATKSVSLYTSTRSVRRPISADRPIAPPAPAPNPFDKFRASLGELALEGFPPRSRGVRGAERSGGGDGDGKHVTHCVSTGARKGQQRCGYHRYIWFSCFGPWLERRGPNRDKPNSSTEPYWFCFIS